MSEADASVNRRIIAGTLLTSGAAVFISTVVSAVKRHPNIGSNAISTGFNAGITAGCFFVLRDRLITPALVKTIPSPYYAKQRIESGITPLSKDSQYTPDQLEATSRRSRMLDTFLSGAITGGTIRTLTSGARSFIPSALLFGGLTSAIQYTFNMVSIPKPIQDRRSLRQSMLGMLGFQTVSDEEYLARLKKLRAKYLSRIEELERELEEKDKE